MRSIDNLQRECEVRAAEVESIGRELDGARDELGRLRSLIIRARAALQPVEHFQDEWVSDDVKDKFYEAYGALLDECER